MDQNPGPSGVSAIIPAFNEEGTILEVIHIVEAHPLIDEVIVVVDGSTDATAAQANRTRASVISLPSNEGKATAMSKGVEAARNEIIFFLDADLIGLTDVIVSRLIQPVLAGGYGMYVAARDRRIYWLNKLLRFTPILGGERVLTKKLWNQIPMQYVRNFQIEIALNFFAKRLGHRTGFEVMSGLRHVIKEKKYGLIAGFFQRLLMFRDLLVITFKLYVLRAAGPLG